MNEDIFKKPNPSDYESYFILALKDKTPKDMSLYISKLDPTDVKDRELLQIISKKFKDHLVRIEAGKMLYY